MHRSVTQKIPVNCMHYRLSTFACNAKIPKKPPPHISEGLEEELGQCQVLEMRYRVMRDGQLMAY